MRIGKIRIIILFTLALAVLPRCSSRQNDLSDHTHDPSPLPRDAAMQDTIEKDTIIYKIDTAGLSRWDGVYTIDTIAGRDPAGAAIMMYYTIEVSSDTCKLSCIGYQMYSTDLCTVKAATDTLFIYHFKTIEGFSRHEQLSPLIKLYKRDGSYFVRSGAIAVHDEEELKIEKD